MEPDADEIDITLRSPAEVGRRMIALSAVAHRLGIDPDDEWPPGPDDEEDDPDDAPDPAAESYDWSTWLAQEGILDALTSDERRLVLGADLAVPDDLVDEAGAGGESLGALAWAARLSEPTVLDRGYPYLALLDAVPSPWDDTVPFLAALALRDEPEIALAREAAEILSWRAQVEVERRRADGRALRELEEAIRDVGREAAASGVAPVGSDGDILIGGEPLRSLSDPVVAGMVAAARARLRAMSWLCGLGDWDDPALTEI